MLARTLMQPASVTSFGLKCANWAAPLVRNLRRLQTVKQGALKVQLGGGIGTLARMGDKGPQITAHMARSLGLDIPCAPWHTQRDEWIALGCELGLMAGSLGKIAKDLSLLGQFEVAEVWERHEPGRGASSDIPHKHNPVASMAALAAAQRVPQRIASPAGHHAVRTRTCAGRLAGRTGRVVAIAGVCTCQFQSHGVGLAVSGGGHRTHAQPY